MILVTGGLGFIGTHTARALLDLGQSCVLLGRRAVADADVSDLIASEIGSRAFIEQGDVTDLSSLLKVGARHEITGVVHLAAGGWPPSANPIEDARATVNGLLNVLQAARDWGVARVGVASTIGVYGGVPLPEDSAASGVAVAMREDMPLPPTAGHAIPASKKIGELLADYVAGATGLEVYNARVAGIWGPLGRPVSRFFGAPQLVHAAVRGTAPDFSELYSPAHAQDSLDLCYARDCGRALALLQLAPRLNHRTYNVGGGRATTYQQLADALAEVVPGSRIELPEGRNPHGPARDFYLDITRVRQDAGYEPAYDTQRAVADYVDWLRAGHDR
ncbi:MAG TPA: NAD(P)-dependent oxidoreductase [Actinocrinis sp.]|uniref:NAD-dependent epimerase/dehydratase family protein n=1 Tax=Actinocrinis sp. TaxID=1920516 RepID=UPI002D346E67|nr:NAD(P)-dependent oxidoreductase [Actinocrinis sp.]HZU58603.1 NAD(P)-dependent oxidoreductase [Actinocrinis sp.]